MIKRKIELKNIVRQFPGFSGGWCLIDYIPRSADAGSLSLLKYKKCEKSSVDKWNRLAAQRIKALNVHFDYVIRALGSKEIHACEGKPLDQLGNMLANVPGCVYMPGLIRKNRIAGVMHRLGRISRRKEARDIYAVQLAIKPAKAFNILVIDDIITTGSTLEQIRRVLRNAFPLANIYFFVFGRTINKFARKVKRGNIF